MDRRPIAGKTLYADVRILEDACQDGHDDLSMIPLRGVTRSRAKQLLDSVVRVEHHSISDVSGSLPIFSRVLDLSYPRKRDTSAACRPVYKIIKDHRNCRKAFVVNRELGNRAMRSSSSVLGSCLILIRLLVYLVLVAQFRGMEGIPYHSPGNPRDWPVVLLFPACHGTTLNVICP